MNQGTEILAELERLADRRSGLFSTACYAQTLDGHLSLAPGVATRLSSPDALRLTHQLRAFHDAILVGSQTVLVDDPQLNVRHASGLSPTRIILDGRGRTPAHARVFCDGGPTLLFTTRGLRSHCHRAASASVEHVFLDDLRPPTVLAELERRGFQRLMVEGGGEVLNSFMGSGSVDAVVATVAHVLGAQEGSPRYNHGRWRRPQQLEVPKIFVMGTSAVFVGALVAA